MPLFNLSTANNLTTLAAVKNGVVNVQATTSGSTTGFDSELIGLIDAVSVEFNRQTGRLLKKRTNTRYLDGNGKATLVLQDWPIHTTGSIDVRVLDERENFSTTTEFTTGTKVPSTELAVYSSGGRMTWTADIFPKGNLNVQVTLTAGYNISSSGGSTGVWPLPPDLRNAVHERIAYRWERNRHNRIGYAQITDAVGSESFGAEPPSIMEAINRHRDVRLG